VSNILARFETVRSATHKIGNNKRIFFFRNKTKRRRKDDVSSDSDPETIPFVHTKDSIDIEKV